MEYEFRIGDEVIGVDHSGGVLYPFHDREGVITRLPRSKNSKRYYANFFFPFGTVELAVYPNQFKLKKSIITYDETWI